MADISKINGCNVMDSTARDNHNVLVQEINETIEAINESFEQLDDKYAPKKSTYFEGTRAEYETAYAAGLISIGSFVVITDEDGMDASTSSILGEAILGQMILG